MSGIEIKCGDAISLLKDLPDNSINLIVADPPYNLGKDYGNNHDLKGFDDYLEFTRQWTSEAKRVLKDDGSMYVFMGVRFISYLYDILDREQELFFNNWLVWHYTQGLGKTKGFSPRHDDVLVFNKTKNFKFNLDDVRVPQKYYRARNNMRGANPGDVWKFSHVHYSNPNRQNHPTQKPEGLIERMILASSDKGDVVLDPFSGSGTTLRVCQQLERKGVGFELNPEYVEMTKARLAEPFNGFDSVDPRMERVPNDLRNPEIRDEYLANHINWFLKNHENAIDLFTKAVKEKYGVVLEAKGESKSKQGELF
ncbi:MULTISPECIES: DNA-methyltransferase [Cysteiniphilum]|uniref:DNA-methyltransferase n=1 Tax=Cysteiniphilum TaxID=2056696 RepID=UPI00178264A6|nr:MULTISPECIES: DNA methyltransferase [Cysteiniphilum]